MLECEVARLLERVERRLDVTAVEHDDLDVLVLDEPLDPLRVTERGHARIGDEQRAPHAESPQLPAGVGGGAGTELDRRRLEREDALVHRA